MDDVMTLKSCFISLLFLGLSVLSATCQDTVSGRVIDRETNEPLAFVNFIINGDDQKGTVSDVHGKFVYSSKEEIVLITCSYVGYEKLNVSFQKEEEKTNLSISMQPSAYHFGEVVVRAGENPAHRIIRKVIENRPINNPEEIASFRYTSYNKVLYDFVYSNPSEADSVADLLNNVFRGGHVLIMESVADRKFIQPDISEEVIRGVKVSGFKHPSFAPLATDLQPFSFYREIIPIFDVHYINPISQGSLGKYQFTLEDTIYQNFDTTFIISYKPLPGKNFAGLKGLLYINTNTYAIQHVIASPADKGLIDINIQQQYEYLNAAQWFPAELNFEFTMYPNGLENAGISANGVSYIDSVDLLPDLRKRDFALEAVRMDELAAVQDTLFWNAHRKEPLSEQERTTYEVVDSLGAKYKFDAILGIAEKLSRDRIGIGWLDIDVSKTLVLNEFEGLRLGFGAYTNEKLFKHFSVGGFFGYGLKDHQWKYGGDFIWTLDKQNEILINGEYQNTLVEAGKNNLRFFDKRQYDFRSWLANQMDRIERSRLAFGFRAFRYAKFSIAFRHTTTTPQYAYQYAPLGEEGMLTYKTTDLMFGVRYALKEKLIQSMGQRISRGTKYPVVSLFYTRGMEGVLQGQFTYDKLEARIEQTFYTKSLGKTKIRVDAGYVDRSLPYGLLFTGEGSYNRNFGVQMKNYFQTVGLYEFVSDRYVNLFFTHSFESLLFSAGKFKPHISIYQSIGWGTLSNPEDHLLVDFKTKELGLYESGIQIDNLLKINYLNVAYLGFGLGAYYRYGPYAGSHFKDNVAYTFSMTFTTQ